MKNIDKLSNIINKRLKISLESITVKDLLEVKELEENEQVLSEYLDMSISHFLSLLKLNRLYQNKKIDDNTFVLLRNSLKDYYRLKNKIAEVDYVSYISDNLNIENTLNIYDDLLRDNYKFLSQYNVLYDPIDDRISDTFINSIDKKIRKKRKH